MTKIKLILVAGARPNFMKIAPLMEALSKYADSITQVLVHTGQHYDSKMSDNFFEELRIPTPHYNLGVGGGSHAEQTAKIMLEFEKVCLKEKPDMIIVVGDVNSTVACALVGKKLGIKIAHVESGLRSFDERMPEEINRIITDRISDILFVSEKSGLKNLKDEGVPDNKIHFVGNIMIDTLVKNLDRKTDIISKLGLGEYCVVTMHRPSNVDTKEELEKVLDALTACPYKIVWPLHPRTLKNINQFGLKDLLSQFIILEPLGYLDFITLVSGSAAVITDSGGIQEETTYLGIPCITIRENTERPSTIDEGTNILAKDIKIAKNAIMKINKDTHSKKKIPDLWDGHTGDRIAKILDDYFKKINS